MDVIVQPGRNNIVKLVRECKVNLIDIFSPTTFNIFLFRDQSTL